MKYWILLAAWLAGTAALPLLVACPFCGTPQQTLRQEMGVMDAIAIAESTAESIRDEESGKVNLKVVSVLKGDAYVKPDETITAAYFGKVEKGRRFMISGADPTNIQWTCIPVSEASEKYMLELTKLTDDPVERLKFYQPYLQHPDSMLNRDAYDEFAITPYQVVQQLKPFMDHDQLVSWISDQELPSDRKRLYLTMLGVCGSEKDLPLLDDMLRSTQTSSRGGLDALIACYLVIAGEPGLATIDELFLENSKAPYADTYAAVAALRVLGTETERIPRSSLAHSMHHILERKDLADLVISDLARWGDWSQIDRLEQLFNAAEKDNNWVRVPVVNYMRACPKPEAAAALARMKLVDPDSVRRASTFFAIPVPSPAVTPASRSEIVPVPDAMFGSTKLPIPPTFRSNREEVRLASLAFAPRTEHAFAIARGLTARKSSTPVVANWSVVACVPLIAFGSVMAFLNFILRGRSLSFAAKN